MNDDIEVVLDKDYYNRFIYRVDNNKPIGTYIALSHDNNNSIFIQFNKYGEYHGIKRVYHAEPFGSSSIPYLNGKKNGIGFGLSMFDTVLEIVIYKDNMQMKTYGPYIKEDRIIPFNIG